MNLAYGYLAFCLFGMAFSGLLLAYYLWEVGGELIRKWRDRK